MTVRCGQDISRIFVTVAHQEFLIESTRGARGSGQRSDGYAAGVADPPAYVHGQLDVPHGMVAGRQNSRRGICG